jgi:hypothetical protein
LPDGTSEIFLREGMDRFSRATTDLPVGQIICRSEECPAIGMLV